MKKFIPFDHKRHLFAEEWKEVVDGEVFIKIQIGTNLKIYKVDQMIVEEFYQSIDDCDARLLYNEVNAANRFHALHRDRLSIMMVSFNLN